MGRKSTKENKNIYQITRENLGLTREEAAELLEYISDDRIEKIENEKSIARPEEVLSMAEKYKAPLLCNYYCSHECPIGQKSVPELEIKDLSQITIELLASLNALEKSKNRMVEIAVDGIISSDEEADFESIRLELNTMNKIIDSLSLWVDSVSKK